MTEDTQPRPDLAVLAPFATVFARPDFIFGTRAECQVENGTMQMPYFSLSEVGNQFYHAVYDGHWVRSNFSWPTWAGGEEARHLRDDGGAIEVADIMQLAKLLTTIVRNDRFSDGVLASTVESGLILRVLQRIEELYLESSTFVALPDDWFRMSVHDGVSLDRPGIYEWHIEGVGIYVGKFTRSRRPMREYTLNVKRLLSGSSYRKSKVGGFRRIHIALAEAVKNSTPIELRIVENPDPAIISVRERELIAERGTLNGPAPPRQIGHNLGHTRLAT